MGSQYVKLPSICLSKIGLFKAYILFSESVALIETYNFVHEATMRFFKIGFLSNSAYIFIYIKFIYMQPYSQHTYIS